ncbi:hypothetical protein IU485_15295 [Nocardia cyriacigeorgica]|uniref:DUF6980 family protein n=1 Tax=Nocardia cyriacigeorgica TaxID=135487 RepID=UPI00189555B3|nr:hypothetical protein [Nocardia cyriacigeorgica]BDU05049.1 hypothetical protein FMUBM48_13120 [Nocardia cyriacigeorgica]
MSKLPHGCEDMSVAVTSEDFPIEYDKQFREYGLRILDGGSSILTISFCPFCGAPLPESKRDAWFDALDALGLEPGDPDIPDDMLTDAWWAGEESGPA